MSPSPLNPLPPSPPRQKLPRPPVSTTPFFNRGNILALFVGSGAYVVAYLIFRLINENEVSSLVFLAMPFLTGALVAYMVPDPKHAIPASLMNVVFNLLISPAIFGEGAICIIMAAPIFVVAALIGAVCGSLARRKQAPKTPLLLLLILFAFLIIHDVWTLRAGAAIDTVRNEFKISGTRADVWKRMTFDRAPKSQVPLWMRLWVAQPKRFSFAGEGIGAQRFVDFGERTYGDDPDALRNKFVYEITAWNPQESCVFTCRENHSRARQWLTLIDTRIELSAADNANEITVTMTSRYRRKLGPGIYFTPFLNAAVSGMNQMLAEELSDSQTPR